MELKNQHIDFNSFRKYYTGAMSSDEKINFEKNIDSDPFAKEAFEGFLLLENDFNRISSIENTNIALKEKFGIEEKSTFPIKSIFAIAATMVVLIGSYFAISSNFKNQNEFAEHKTESIESIVINNDELGLQDNSTNEIYDSLDFSNDTLKEIADDNIVIEETEIKNSKEKSIYENKKTNKTDKADIEIIKQTPKTKKQISAEQFDFYRNQKKSENKVVANSSKDEINVNAVTEVSSTTSNSIYYEPESIVPTTENTNYKKGIVAFNNKEYSKAIRLLNTSIYQKKNISSSNYYLGLISYNQNKPTKAIKYFDKMIHSNSSFKEDAQWYKSLALIRRGNKNDALILLKKIINSNSKHAKSATVKLKEL